MNKVQEKEPIFDRILDVLLQLVWFALPASSVFAITKSLGAPIWFSIGVAFIVFYLAAIIDKINGLKGK